VVDDLSDFSKGQAFKRFYCCNVEKVKKNPKSKSGLLQIELTVFPFEPYLCKHFTEIRPQLGKVKSLKPANKQTKQTDKLQQKNITFLAEVTNAREKQGLSVDLTQQ